MFNDNQYQLFNDLINDGKMNEIPKRVIFMKLWDELRTFFDTNNPDDIARLDEFDCIMEALWSEDRFNK
jgi:hypothetical protein